MQPSNAQIDALVAMLDALRPSPPTTARVSIPGNLVALYEDGAITRWTFTPHAGDAGYFGPSAIVVDYDDTDYTGDGVEMFDVESADGPFWDAVRANLLVSGVEWTE